MRRTNIIAAAVLMILVCSNVLAVCPEDASQEKKKINPECPEFELSADNINEIPLDQIESIDPDMLNPQVLAEMDDDRIGSLESSQLTPNVLRMISEEDRLSAVDHDAFMESVNIAGAVRVTGVGSLDGVSVSGTTADSLFIEDSQGNGVRLSEGSGSISFDDEGVMHIEEADGMAVWHDRNRLGDFSGSGTVDENGEFICSEACSITSFGNEEITVRFGDPQKKIVIRGNDGGPAVVEIGPDGKIIRLKGTILEGTDKDLETAEVDSGHYTMILPPGSTVDFENNELRNAEPPEECDRCFINVNYWDGEGLQAQVHYHGDGSETARFSMSRDETAFATGCDEEDNCNYVNRNTERVNDIYEEGENNYLSVHAGNDGGFEFDARDERSRLEIRGENAKASIVKGSDDYASVSNTGDRLTNIGFGDFPEELSGANSAAMLSSEHIKGRGEDMDVGVGDNHVEICDSVTMEAGVRINDVDVPEIDIKPLESTLTAPLVANLAVVTIGDQQIPIRPTGFFPPRDLEIEGDFILSAMNTDGDKGEVMYHHGTDSVVVEAEFDEFGSIVPGTAQVKTWKSGLGITINGEEEEVMMEVLQNLGVSDSAIYDVRNRLNYRIFDRPPAEEVEEAEDESEESAEEAEEGEEGTGEVTGQAEGRASARWENVDPRAVRPGSVNGRYYTNDEDVKAMLDSMGYTGPNAVRNFQRDSGIGVDGIVGIQTSAALLKVCSQNPGCNAEAMTNYENKVGTNVESAATRAEESPGESAVRKHTPSERKGTDGVSIPNKPMEGDIKFE
ncbi:hypothetical protein GF345_05230, partial [Candidatus Woesearchaeota archaeon]|nr:hypothetical protein [Candidatus Woesearchaeota archaeon]